MTTTSWEHFQLGDRLDGVREEILTSWRRSRLSGVDPERIELPYDEPMRDSRFLAAARPVVDGLAETMVGADTCLALTDPAGQILARWVTDPALRADLDDLEIAEGFILDEGWAGTNGVGTSLEDRGVITVRGQEHYKKPFHGFTCTAAPVYHPLTRRPLGAVNITCRVEATNALLEPTVRRLVRDVEAAVLASAGTRQRQLFDAFLRERSRGRSPVITVGPDVLITNDAAAGLPLDQQQLWQRVQAAVDTGGTVALPGLPDAEVTMRLLRQGSRICGAVLRVTGGQVRGAAEASPPQVPTARLAELVSRVVRGGGVAVVRGEGGVGKTWLLRQVLPDARVVECTPGAATTEALTDLAGERPLVLRRLDRLPGDQVEVLTRWRPPAGVPLAATLSCGTEGPPPALLPLLHAWQATVVELPPLRLRLDELDGIVTELTGTAGRWTAAALQALRDHPWPGNVAELVVAVRSAVAVAAGQPVGVAHLPLELRAGGPSRRLGLLEQAEARLIAEVLAATGGNKAAAARQLGVSRPTLYAKLRTYRLAT